MRLPWGDNYVLFDVVEGAWDCTPWIRLGKHADWRRAIRFTVFSSYAYSEDEHKYVGIAPIATGYRIETCSGVISVEIEECWSLDCPPSFRR